jgi:superfamily II DNA or RNA helicase
VKLRNYQHDAIDAVRKHWTEFQSPAAVVLPTGAGKTVVFSSLAQQLEAEGKRVLVVMHREELVQQTVAKLKAVGCHSVGVVKAERNETWARIVVATVQTLYSERRLKMIGGVDVVIYDEMHHSVSKRNRKLLTDLGCFDGRALAVGFTATFMRTDKSKLADDWSVVMERDAVWAIEHGFLTDVVAHSIRVPNLDTTKVKTKAGGDYADGDLGRAMEASSAAEVIPVAWRKYAEGRPTILFAPTISSAQQLSDALNDAGIVSETVFGHTPSHERNAVYDRIRSGHTKILASVGVLTEGFDIPAISCAIMARPTKSKGLWQQMAGRALRLFPGKDVAVLLDITGDVENHSLASITDLRPKPVADEDKKPSTPMCACFELMATNCCSDLMHLMTCRKNKLAGTCNCECLCELQPQDDVEITLVHGDEDVEVDLFAGSESVWLKTWQGVWFVPTQSRVYFIAQQSPDSGYYVGCSGTTQSMEGGRWLTPEPLDITTAMALAQEAAENEDSTVSRRDAKWRRTKPSAAQLRLAAGLGLLPEDMASTVRKGPVSDVISMHFASRMLDPKIGHWLWL